MEQTTGHERAVEQQLAKIADDLETIRFAVWTVFVVMVICFVIGLIGGVWFLLSQAG